MNDDQGSRDAVLREPGEHSGSPASNGVPAEPEAQRAVGAHRARAGSARPARGGRGRRPRSFWVEFPLLVVIALAIALLIKSFVVQAFFIPSGSMENTLLIGDKVLVNKVIYDFRSPARGDIIVFDGADSWGPAGPPAAHSSNPVAEFYDVTLGRLFSSIGGLFGTVPGQTDYIKRVIGIPGDRVGCCTAHGLMTVNGVPLHETSYLYPGAQPSQYHFSVIVPPGRLWVMGDNRFSSADSRYHMAGYPGAHASPGNGTIPENQVIGRAFVIVWPPSRWRILSIPQTFGQPALARAAAAAASPGGLRIRPAGQYLPLAAGAAVTLPIGVLRRRSRRRSRRG